jgi:hypothetical protein
LGENINEINNLIKSIFDKDMNKNDFEKVYNSIIKNCQILGNLAQTYLDFKAISNNLKNSPRRKPNSQ